MDKYKREFQSLTSVSLYRTTRLFQVLSQCNSPNCNTSCIISFTIGIKNTRTDRPTYKTKVNTKYLSIYLYYYNKIGVITSFYSCPSTYSVLCLLNTVNNSREDTADTRCCKIVVVSLVKLIRPSL